MKHWLKNIASWQIGKTLYLSVVFSWDVARAAKMAREHKGTVIVGGPAAMLNREAFDGVAAVRDTCQEAEPILFHNPLASYSFYPEQHAHGWTQHDLKRVHRYYSRLNWLGHIPFADYNVAHEELFT